MAGDFSRSTFDRDKHYAGVLMQQGRVQLDADWNEQGEIQRRRAEIEERDIIGCGTPKNEGGFLIATTPRGQDLMIGSGRYYVDGLLCELEATSVAISSFPNGTNNQAIVASLRADDRKFAEGQWVAVSAAQKSGPVYARITAVQEDTRTLTFDTDVSAYHNAGAATIRRVVTYTTQADSPDPDFTIASPASGPNGESIVLGNGSYLVYLDAWLREVTALEDPNIHEVALGEADTAARLQTVWQVKLLPLKPNASPPACCEQFDDWNTYFPPPTGTLAARTVAPAQATPCSPLPAAGYQSLENQLYRVEIFQASQGANRGSFVWSRDNGSVEIAINRVDNTDLYLSSLGKDDVLGLAIGQWVEIVDRDDELANRPRVLFQIANINQITQASQASDPSSYRVTLNTSASNFANRAGLRVRRWDVTTGATANGIPITPGWIDLENGIQVQFSDGTYAPRDYWQIPARTATGTIEWRPAGAHARVGIRHHYCILARLTVSGGVFAVADCRAPFPRLTDICADDVCFDSDVCGLNECSTVADALEKLCRENDLRFHNKHLHGWGIVCGLEVVCGPNASGAPRHVVTVRSGYAIGCDGSDVLINKDQAVDIVAMLTASPANYTVPDGEYALILDPKTPGNFRAVPYTPPANTLPSLLQNTLLMDFYNDCILKLIVAIQNEFQSNAPGAGVVTAGQEHLSAFTNLLVQLINPDAGSFVFVSGDKDGPRQEDKILRDFYNTLRGILQSSTYCAMFDGARQFPAYPYSGQGINTIFGKGFKTRVRVDPTGSRAYTVGVDNVIHVYDLNAATPNLALELQFPSAGAVVQDVAFSSDGTQLYATASLGQDSLFATASVNGMTHTWGATSVICGVLLTTLVTHTAVTAGVSASSVYAAGAGKGLYTFDPKNVPAQLNPIAAFPAFGHLVIDEVDGWVFATVKPNATSSFFNTVSAFTLTGKQFFSIQLPGQGTWDDDIALVSPSQGALALYATAASAAQGHKSLLAYTLNAAALKAASATGAAPPAPGLVTIDLGENTPVRLAYNQVTNFLMVALDDSYRVRLYKPGAAILEDFRHPVQISPLSIAYNDKSGKVYVLNYASNTISQIPAALLATPKQMDLNALVTYRTGVINAFYDLLGGTIQYLKDCLCDHFLVSCPDCSNKDTNLYLGCVSMRNGQIQKICNFEKRKQVKMFPKVDYWLSIVPIMPLLGKLVETICCAALPDIFAKFSAPAPAPSVLQNPKTAAYNVRLSGATARSGISYVQQTNFKNILTSGLSNVLSTRQFLSDFTSTATPKWTPPPPTPVSLGNVAGTSVDNAKTTLTNAQVNVDSVVTYDPSQLAANAGSFIAAQRDLPPGSSVTLVADQQGVVRYYIPTQPAVTALRTDLQTSQQQVQENTQAVQQAVTAGQQLQTRVAAAETALSDAQQQVANNTEAVSQASTLAMELRTRMATAETNVSSTQQLLAQTAATANQTKSDLTTAQQGLATLQTTLAQTNTTANQVKTDLAAAEQSLAQTQAQVTQTSAAATQTRSDLSVLQQTVAANQATISAAGGLPAQIAALQQKLTELQTSHTQALAQVADLQKQLTTVSGQIKKINPNV